MINRFFNTTSHLFYKRSDFVMAFPFAASIAWTCLLTSPTTSCGKSSSRPLKELWALQEWIRLISLSKQMNGFVCRERGMGGGWEGMGELIIPGPSNWIYKHWRNHGEPEELNVDICKTFECIK